MVTNTLLCRVYGIGRDAALAEYMVVPIDFDRRLALRRRRAHWRAMSEATPDLEALVYFEEFSIWLRAEVDVEPVGEEGWAVDPISPTLITPEGTAIDLVSFFGHRAWTYGYVQDTYRVPEAVRLNPMLSRLLVTRGGVRWRCRLNDDDQEYESDEVKWAVILGEEDAERG